jgi:hypothetical protein
MFVILFSHRNRVLKWAIVVGLIVMMYSLSYFYYMLPGSDSQSFRGMTEYYFAKDSIAPSRPYHEYFEQPGFFFLERTMTSVTGLNLRQTEFIIYTGIGILLITSLFVYVSRKDKEYGPVAVAGYFVSMFYFLNYQNVPFSLALALLFALFMLEQRLDKTLNSSYGTILVTLVLFTSMTFIHLFVPLFYVLYLLVKYAFTRARKEIGLFLLTLTIYATYQVLQAPLSFETTILSLTRYASPEFGTILQQTLAPASVPLDILAQSLSRVIVVGSACICAIGFLIMFREKRLTTVDKAILFSAGAYSVVGIVIPILGSRAIAVAFVPIALGTSYMLRSRYKRLVQVLLLVFLGLFLFIPLHQTFYDSQIMSQTREAYAAEDFVIAKYDWTDPSLVLAHIRVQTYLVTKQKGNASVWSDSPTLFSLHGANEYDSIVYTIGLGKSLLRFNCTIDEIVERNTLNTAYDNGYSHISVKSHNFSWMP